MNPALYLVAAYLAVGLMVAGVVATKDRTAPRLVLVCVLVGWPLVAAFVVISTLVLYLLGTDVRR